VLKDQRKPAAFLEKPWQPGASREIVVRPENAVIKQSTRFRPGQSGKAAGKPKGTRHRITMLAENLMEKDAEQIVEVVLAAAKGGEIPAIKLVLDRMAPRGKDA
jgi:hypothetical protein